jgi:hypothetical protein
MSKEWSHLGGFLEAPGPISQMKCFSEEKQPADRLKAITRVRALGPLLLVKRLLWD